MWHELCSRIIARSDISYGAVEGCLWRLIGIKAEPTTAAAKKQIDILTNRFHAIIASYFLTLFFLMLMVVMLFYCFYCFCVVNNDDDNNNSDVVFIARDIIAN